MRQWLPDSCASSLSICGVQRTRLAWLLILRTWSVLQRTPLLAWSCVQVSCSLVRVIPSQSMSPCLTEDGGAVLVLSCKPTHCHVEACVFSVQNLIYFCWRRLSRMTVQVTTLCPLSWNLYDHCFYITDIFSVVAGWQQNESRFSQLIYTFQVEACHPNGTACPLLTLYKWVQLLFCSYFDLNKLINVFGIFFLRRGTRSSFGSLLPIGRLGQERSMSVVTAVLLIEDHLGTRVLALKKYRFWEPKNHSQ